MVVPFGVGVGDVVAVAKLAKTIISELQKNSEAAWRYQCLVLELETLGIALSHVNGINPGQHDLHYLESIRAATAACQLTLERFLQKLKKYDGSMSVWNAAKNQIRGLGRRLQYDLVLEEDVMSLKATLSTYIGIINMLIQAQSLASITRAETKQDNIKTSSISNSVLFREITSLRSDVEKSQSAPQVVETSSISNSVLLREVNSLRMETERTNEALAESAKSRKPSSVSNSILLGQVTCLRVETQGTKMLLESQKSSSISNSTLFREVVAHREETRETKLTLEAYLKDLSDLRTALALEEATQENIRDTPEMRRVVRYMKQGKSLSDPSVLSDYEIENLPERKHQDDNMTLDADFEQLESIGVEDEPTPGKALTKSPGASVFHDPLKLLNAGLNIALRQVFKGDSPPSTLRIAKSSSSILKPPTVLDLQPVHEFPTKESRCQRRLRQRVALKDYEDRSAPYSMPPANSEILYCKLRGAWVPATEVSEGIACLDEEAFLWRIAEALYNIRPRHGKLTLRKKVEHIRAMIDEELTFQAIKKCISAIELQGTFQQIEENMCVDKAKKTRS